MYLRNRLLSRGSGCRVGGASSQGRPNSLEWDGSLTKKSELATGRVDDGRWGPSGSGSAIQDEVDPAREPGFDLVSGRGREGTGPIGARGRNRASGRSGQLSSNGKTAHADCDSGPECCFELGPDTQYEGDWPGPKTLRRPSDHLGDLSHELLELREVSHDTRQLLVSLASLDREHPCARSGVEGIDRQTVERLGWICHDATVAQDRDRLRKQVRVRRGWVDGDALSRPFHVRNRC